MVDPIVDLMVAKGILDYCVQETWIVGNVNTAVRNHMIFFTTGRKERLQQDEDLLGELLSYSPLQQLPHGDPQEQNFQ